MTSVLRRKMLLAAVVAATLIAGSERVGACSCIATGPPCAAAFWSEGAFVGQVESLTEDTESISAGDRNATYRVWRVRMKVSEVLRGDVPAELDVFTSTSSSACGYSFAKGRTYLVYAYRQINNKRWSTGICSRTRPLEDASDDLSFLRGARQGRTLSVLRGTAERQTPVQTEYGMSFSRQPYPGLRIEIETVGAPVGKKYQATTNTAGEYAIQVPVGRYRLTPALPPSQYVYSPAIADLKDPTGCASTDFVVQSNGRIGGRVVDTDQRPVPYLTIEVVPAGAVSQPYYGSTGRAMTDANGEFEFTRLEAGTFRLGLDLRKDPRQASTSVWFTDDQGKAFEVPLGTEARVWTRTFVLPATVSLALISGRVDDEVGKPAAGTRVYLLRAPGFGIEAETVSGADGAFHFNARAGRRYRISAELVTPDRPFRRAESPAFDAASGVERFELRLKAVK